MIQFKIKGRSMLQKIVRNVSIDKIGNTILIKCEVIQQEVLCIMSVDDSEE
ncbi:unnamed protein product [Paramecium sonneborni]|uniref:Uncharacterized protein n=1 Tax=Paramecium sonneborni TaxID=65129 RepID=A0A8S1P2P6_9CILI|nr:unnamed protein product [Paramecium sonneborni]